MRGAVNIGQNNEELVDNLIRLGYIRSKEVERVFRVVDRACYILKSHKESAYKDVAWKNGNIHLSAPCIYSEVLETLALEPGLSFLNLGSGTGYLSTMAGLLLSSCGINHGVELHEDCLKYAYEKLEEFKQNSVALDEFDFCEPIFIQGNCLSVIPGRQYNRVYCGAACPEYYEGFIKQFVTTGGILVMPTKDHLLRLQKLDDDTWSIQSLLPVSFATLTVPSDGEHNTVHLPEYVPRTLQQICRDGIRQCLRNNIWHEHADIITTRVIIRTSFLEHYSLISSKWFQTDFVIPTFDTDSDSNTSDDDLDSGKPVTALNQFHRDSSVEFHNQNELKVINNLRHYLENCLENKTFNEFVKHNQISNMSKPIALCKIPMARGGDQQQVTDGSSRGTNKNEVTRESMDINILSDPQNDKKTNYAFMSICDQNTVKERITIQQEYPVNHQIQLNPKSGNSSNESSQIQSTSKTITNIRIDGFCTNSFTSLMQSSRFKNSNDTIKAIVKNTHHVDNNAFTEYMVDKICKLPLPHFLKMYINYNRPL